MTLAIVIRIIVSIFVGLIGGGIGTILLLPALMAWDSGNPSFIMKLISYTSLSISPAAIIAAILSCIFGYVYLLIAAIPIVIVLLCLAAAMIVGWATNSN